MGAGISFGRRPQEAGQKDKGGCVLEERQPVKSVLLTCGQLGLGASGTQNKLQIVSPEHGSLGID